MRIVCGEYKHFKGKKYTVYGEAKTVTGENFVLYRQNYDSKDFWVRPTTMFYDKVSDEGIDTPRFRCIKNLDATKLFQTFIDIAKKESIPITHSETGIKYRLISVNETTTNILLAPVDSYSSYLTDSQLAFRMGYDLYDVNGKIYANGTSFDLPDDQRMTILTSDDGDMEQQLLNVIKNQLNPCSIDLHIADDFYRPKCKIIDMANATHYSAMPQEPWKKITLRTVRGQEGIVLLPKQTIVTYTHEKICLPMDCAGKIEIKSTYARLSLSVTASDFCNPGWSGHFPLSITNNGSHIIVLHPKEKMLQLSLVPTGSSIICRYPRKGVFMNDDGTPFKFWQSQTVKRMPSDLDRSKLLKFNENVLKAIEKSSTDVESEQKRFQETFLLFCQRKVRKNKYKGIKDQKEKLKALWDAYKKKERTLRFFFSKPVKFSSFIVLLGTTLLPAGAELYSNGKLSRNMITGTVLAVVALIVAFVVFYFKTPCCYCTFEKLEFNKIYSDK